VALAMLPVAEEYKKILLVEPAVADSITGDKWNKYIFRTGRNSSQDAIANAVALDKAGTTHGATLAQDNAFGRDGVKAFKEAIKKAKVAHEEYLPAATTDFTAAAAHHRQAEGPARPQDRLDHLGRRQPVQDRRSGASSATASRSPPAATSCRR
jgi:ABC-type branched-subunit amino acid transport system substrate-binding protein